MQTTPGADGGVDVSARIHSTGSVARDEVAQAYLDKPAMGRAGLQLADDVLAGFERVHLTPGESTLVTIHVPLRQMQYWSMANHAWVTPEGPRPLSGLATPQEIAGCKLALQAT